MRIILVTAGSYGDVLPFIHIGKQLKTRGYQVTLVTSQYFQNKVLENDLEFYGFSTHEAYEQLLKSPDIFAAKKGAKAFASGILVPAIEPVYNYIARTHRVAISNKTPERILLIATGFCFGARIAAEKFSIPLVTIKLAPIQFRIDSDRPNHPLFRPCIPNWFTDGIWWLYDKFITDPLIKPHINALRERLGMAPVSRVLYQWWNSPQQVFGLFPDWLLSIDRHWPANCDLIGFPLPAATATSLKKPVEQFLQHNPKPIVFTPGTAVATAKQFFLEAMKIAEQIKKPVIFLTRFNENLPETLPSNCLHLDYVPLQNLLPRVGALVHPGGIGTLAEAIRARVPQLIVPAVNDQFDNAYRVEKLGLGLCLSQKEFTVKNVVPRIDTLFSSKKIHNTLAIRSRSLQHNNLEYIGDRIEEFIRNEGHKCVVFRI